MEHSSMTLSTTLDHSNDEGKGKSKERKRGTETRGTVKQETVKQETVKKARSVFGILREKASALRAGVSNDGRSEAATRSKTERKSKNKSVKNATSAKMVGAGDGTKVKVERVDEDRGEVSRAFARGDYLVHPAHGVGYVRGVEAEDIAGARMDMIAISFEQERMVVRVPTCEYENSGLRCVSSPEAMEGIYNTLKTRRRIRKTMWGRRAQEYDNKIRSGDPVRLAQVVRELYRGEEQPSPSYSERQYYQLALERLSREVAVVEKIEEQHAVEKLETIMAAA